MAKYNNINRIIKGGKIYSLKNYIYYWVYQDND